MSGKKPIVCIMYDFDKTLCTEDMQNYKFIPDVNMNPSSFWGETSEFGDKNQVEKILAYMYMMLKKANDNNIPLTHEYLKSLGTSIEYYKGIETWFKRINDFGKENNIKIEHYVISSGIKDIIDGSKIAKEFKKIYACEYMFDEEGRAIWPRLTINYTQKTQFVFRISKGVENIGDDDTVNSRMSEDKRRVLFRDMIYIGDGITDIPCMQLIKDKGGKSIAVYNDVKKVNAKRLFSDSRVNFVCKADYSENSELEQIVKIQIQSCALAHKLENKASKQRKSILKEIK